MRNCEPKFQNLTGFHFSLIQVKRDEEERKKAAEPEDGEVQADASSAEADNGEQKE